MTAGPATIIVCDGGEDGIRCDRTSISVTVDIRDARNESFRDGWRNMDDEDYCPRHVRKG